MRIVAILVAFVLLGGALGVVVVLSVGWGPGPPPGVTVPVTSIDGRPVGEVTDCAGLHLARARCARVVDAARRELDAGHPGHAPVAAVTLRDTFDATRFDGTWRLLTRSSIFVATVVFSLEDGSARVESIACGVYPPGDPICDPAVP